MQYALMIYAEPSYGAALSEQERAAVQAEFQALLGDARVIEAARLEPAEMATSVRVVGGRTLMTDGPFAETKEALGGFALIEAANLDDAIDLAARIPVTRYGAAIEIRPVVRL
jgi:hypothetical protein